MLNGDGLRVVLWVAGCSWVQGCLNPVTWDPEGDFLFDDKARKNFWKSEKRLYKRHHIQRGRPLFVSKRPGITALAREIRKSFPDKTQWLYTGYEWNRG